MATDEIEKKAREMLAAQFEYPLDMLAGVTVATALRAIAAALRSVNGERNND